MVGERELTGWGGVALHPTPAGERSTCHSVVRSNHITFVTLRTLCITLNSSQHSCHTYDVTSHHKCHTYDVTSHHITSVTPIMSHHITLVTLVTLPHHHSSPPSPPSPPALQAKDLIVNFKVYLPLFAEVCNPAMKEHHWQQVFAAMGQVVPDPDYKFTINDLVQWGIMGKMEVRVGGGGGGASWASLVQWCVMGIMGITGHHGHGGHHGGHHGHHWCSGASWGRWRCVCGGGRENACTPYALYVCMPAPTPCMYACLPPRPVCMHACPLVPSRTPPPLPGPVQHQRRR